MEQLALTLPEMVVDIIAYAAEAMEQRADVARMPVGIQADCLGVVFRLSVPDEKKFQSLLEAVAQRLAVARSVLTSDQSTSSSESSSQGTLTGSSPEGTD
jgi:hypothetical protein